jgi:hypothetical protein
MKIYERYFNIYFSFMIYLYLKIIKNIKLIHKLITVFLIKLKEIFLIYNLRNVKCVKYYHVNAAG